MAGETKPGKAASLSRLSFWGEALRGGPGKTNPPPSLSYQIAAKKLFLVGAHLRVRLPGADTWVRPYKKISL
jgi:hypothetical protein